MDTYKQAEEAASRLINSLGPGWKSHIWENLGWHYAAINGYISVHPSDDKWFAFLSTKLGGASSPAYWHDPGHYDTPQEAVNAQIKTAMTFLNTCQRVIDEQLILMGEQWPMPIKTDSNHPRVYIIAPYSLGDREYNVRRAIAAAETLWRMGFRPFVPILSHYWHLVYPHSEEEWSDLDMYWLEQSDLVAVVPGKSIHGEIEIAHAQILNLPILYLTEKECTPPEQR